MTPKEIMSLLRYGSSAEIIEMVNDIANLIERQEKALEEAEKTLEELIIDQEISVRSEYGCPDIHPAIQKKFERDMASVNDAKIVLASIRALKGK